MEIISTPGLMVAIWRAAELRESAMTVPILLCEALMPKWVILALRE